MSWRKFPTKQNASNERGANDPRLDSYSRLCQFRRGSDGPDAYMISKSEWGFTSGAVHKARLMQEASNYCKGIGKQMIVTSTNENDVALGKTPAAEVHFRCLSPSNPESPQSVLPKQ